MFYLDTCVCIEFLRGRLTYGYKLMQEEGSERFGLPSLVVAELWYGAEHSSNPEKEKKLIETFIDAFQVAPFDEAAAREYGRLRQLLGSKGDLIGDRDMMIAATAIAHNATLVTNNVKDFRRIPNFSYESWCELDF